MQRPPLLDNIYYGLRTFTHYSLWLPLLIGIAGRGTGAPILSLYFDGTAEPSKRWRNEWVLVSAKYAADVPQDWQPPVERYHFKGFNVYSLHRNPEGSRSDER